MKNYIILIIIFVLFTTIAYSEFFGIELLGGTELNGSGCVCHTTERDTTVSIWIEGPDTLFRGETGLYRMYLADGPAQAGGYNVAGKFGMMSLVDSFSVWDYRSPNELTQAFPLVFTTPEDTIYWEFAYTAPDSLVIDTLYSCGLSLVYDSIPDFLDRWNFGTKFPVSVVEQIVPVELISFTASVNKIDVVLNWVTSSETNNMGFEIERKKAGGQHSSNGKEEWKIIAFISGCGTTTEIRNYSFLDSEISKGNYHYRLKQIDFNGNYEYSETIEAEVLVASDFNLDQNYPNPFNPRTLIRWQSPIGSQQTIKVYDALGNEVVVLINEFKPAGSYSVNFDAQNFSSGVYFYKLIIGDRELVKKMILIR